MQKITCRTPGDLAAAAVVALGFVPEKSLMMMVFGPESFHARVDLAEVAPDGGADYLAGIAAGHGARQVAVLAYANDVDDEDAAAKAVALADALTVRDVAVVASLVVGDTRLLRDLTTGERTPFDLCCHPIVAEAVYEGRVTLRSRERLADDLAYSEPAWPAGGNPTGDVDPSETDPARIGAFVDSLDEGAVRDALLLRLDRGNADEWLAFLSRVLQHTPPERARYLAPLTAFAAWLNGNGALAWIALDRAPDKRLGLAPVVEAILYGAVPPGAWPTIRNTLTAA